MHYLTFFFGTGLFFIPFIYIALYLYIERTFNHHILTQNILKIFTVLGGLLIIIYACTNSLDFKVLMPARGGTKNYVPGYLFMVIIGIAIITLPVYSKHIKFSNKEKGNKGD